MSNDKTAIATPVSANRNERPGSQRLDAVAAHAFGLATVMAVLAMMPVLAPAAVSASRVALQENPRLAKLELEIWPEFDRPAALVLLRGELTPETALPAAVTLRIPASSKGPTAVAFANTRGGELFNLEHENKAGPEFITVQFRAPQRYFHVEFYDPIDITTPERRYTYTWPGDLDAGAVKVRVQEPADATDMSVRPALEARAAGTDNLIYREADIGVVKAGKPFPVEIRYTKTASRTSSEILRTRTPDSESPAAAGFLEDLPTWLVAVAVALIVTTVAGTVLVWWRRRNQAPAVSRTGTGFCVRCGSGLDAGDRFCSKCGVAVRGK